ncbi:alpha/beta hydrolase [Nocardia sp. NPDC004860]|uniref:alpha/beta hydrolase n=1 Tax=Nocardia sp. NPDC004860 TaxID=3154557 RepID=UPI0033B8A58C
MTVIPTTFSEKLGAAFFRGLGKLPPRIQRGLAGGGIVEFRDRQLDPGIQLLLRIVNTQQPVDELALPVGRQKFRKMGRMLSGAPVPVDAVHDVSIPGLAGDIPGRLYLPTQPAEPSSLLLFAHGGGFGIGDLDGYDNVCRILAEHSGSRVLSIDYRLAPEHRFPAGYDDCVATYRYLLDHAADFGVEPSRIAVGGESAGANLMTSVCREARDRGWQQPAFQVLFVPPPDLTVVGHTAPELDDGYMLTTALMKWFLARYADESEWRDVRCSPRFADDLSGLAPAYIATAGFDPVCESGEEYVEQLRAAGVTVAHRRHPGLAHPFVLMAGYSRVARDALVEAAGALRTGLAPATTADPAVIRTAR